MGVDTAHGLGRELKFFAVPESTNGTFKKPATGEAAKILACSMGPNTARDVREDSRQTRSALERITGKSTYPWTLEAYVIPSGTAGTPPDLHELYKQVLGTYANNSETSDVYTPANTQSVGLLSLVRHYSDVAMEAVRGAIVESMTISAPGGDKPKVTFEGVAMGHIHTGATTLNGAMSASATMVVATADGRNIHDGSVVKIDADDNSGAGYEVTVDSARPSFTIETTATADNADPVTPFTPTETTAGSPANGIAGSVVLDYSGTPIPINVIAFDVTVANQHEIVEDEAFQPGPTDYIPGWRMVTGSIQFRARKDFIRELGKRHDFTARELRVTIGDTAGAKLQIDLDQVEFEFNDLDMSNPTGGLITLPFTALGSSGEDEIELTFL